MTTCLSTSELVQSGWTPALIRKLLGEPDEKEPFSRGIYRGVRHWYARDRVVVAQERPEFAALQARRAHRLEAPARWRSEFAHRYQTWRGALPDACHYLHSLNRYAKHRECSTMQRAEVYDLKNRMVETLYRTGYCSACWIHEQILPKKQCRECFGSGDEGNCDRCDGSGEYLPAKTIHFYVFRFAIGRGYTWHQPDRLVKFPVVTTREPEQWGGIDREKPLLVNKAKFAVAKELLRWVIELAAGAGPEELPACEWQTAAPGGVAGVQEVLF